MVFLTGAYNMAFLSLVNDIIIRVEKNKRADFFMDQLFLVVTTALRIISHYRNITLPTSSIPEKRVK